MEDQGNQGHDSVPQTQAPEKFNFSCTNNIAKLGVDLNQDGQNSLQVSVNINEAIQEIFSRSNEKGVTPKVATKIDGTNLVVTVDSDQDGENVATVVLNVLELITEGKKLL